MKTLKNVLSHMYNLIKTLIKIIYYSLSVIIGWIYKEFPRTYKQGFWVTWLIIGNIVAFYFYMPISLAETDKLLSEFYIQPLVKTETVIIEKEIVKEITNEDVWVANRIVEAGLNVKEAFVIQKNESGYKNSDNKVGLNSNTVDLGRWQINSQHYGREWTNWKTGEIKKLTLACVVDYKCSTDWAISKRLENGSWGILYGAKKAGIR